MKNKCVKKIKFTTLEKLNKEVPRTQITSQLRPDEQG